MTNVLDIQHVTKQYKNGRGIQDLSFSIKKGEVVGLLGPNGAGKTTLMKCIVSLTHPDQGEILINGNNVQDYFETAMQSVGTLISGVEAIDYMTAYENLLLSSRFYPDLEKARLDEVLSWVGMEKHKNEKIKSFSTGMRQRFYLAVALLSNPSFVILDEPTNGLDIEGKLTFQELIKRLAKEQRVTFLISTHLIEEVERLCDKIVILSNGKSIGQMTKEELYAGENFESYYMECILKEKEVNLHAEPK